MEIVSAGIQNAFTKWKNLSQDFPKVEVLKINDGILAFKLIANEEIGIYTPLWRSRYAAREGVRIFSVKGSSLYEAFTEEFKMLWSMNGGKNWS